jgi:predicted transcriptional regulator
MKRILSEVLRREDGVVQCSTRAGALRIEFIERSRNESLGIECVFAVSDGECVERTDRLEDGVAASGAKTRDNNGWLETGRWRCDRLETEIC